VGALVDRREEGSHKGSPYGFGHCPKLYRHLSRPHLAVTSGVTAVCTGVWKDGPSFYSNTCQ